MISICGQFTKSMQVVAEEQKIMEAVHNGNLVVSRPLFVSCIFNYWKCKQFYSKILLKHL